MAPEVRTLMKDALAALHAEAPAAGSAMAVALGHRHVRVDSESETFLLRSRHAKLTVEDDPGGSAELTVRMPLDAVVRLIDGAEDLLDAVRADRIHVQGALPDIVALREVMVWFVQGAIRSSTCSQLAERAREASRRHPRGSET